MKLTFRRILLCLSCILLFQSTFPDLMASRVPQDTAKLAEPGIRENFSITLEGGYARVRTARCNETLTDGIRVKVTDGLGRAVKGIGVIFTVLEEPDGAEGTLLANPRAVTDSSGLAETDMVVGSKPGHYLVSSRIREGFPDNEVLIRVSARRKNWVYMLVFGLLGGLGLFLFGMHTMSEGLQQSAGARLRSILEHVTRNRIIGIGIGTLVTSIIQSSSATSVMMVSFVNAGLIQFRQTIPVLLGAAIGTTITAQIIAFKVTEYSLLLVATGFYLQAFSKKEQFKSVGYTLFGFGVLFFGMEIMSDAMAPLREWTPFIDLLLRLENPLLGILAGALFTALIQSSSAFVGIMIVLASQGFLTLDASIPLLLGSNLGTTVTALLSSLKSGLEAKKVALSFLAIKLVSVLIFFSWTPQLGRFLTGLLPEAPLPRLIANAHTVINVALAAVILPLSPQLAFLVDRVVGKQKVKARETFSTLYLDRTMLGTPSLALNLAKQEIIRMGMIVRTMFSLILAPFTEKDESALDAVYVHEKEVDYLRDAIKEYLLSINKDAVGSQRVDESFQMLYSMNEFEKIADVISESLANHAEKWMATHSEFSPAGMKELEDYHSRIERQLKRALEVFEKTNLETATHMKSRHKEYRNLSRELEKLHYSRIREGLKESVESSKTHLEILTLFSSIDSHATNIARITLDWKRSPGSGK